MAAFFLIGVVPPVAVSAQQAAATTSMLPLQTLPLTPTRTIAFTTDEGTWLSLDVSPDGRTIVFSLLGDLYTIPIGGGKARRLTQGLAFDRMPRFSPDGRRIAFVSDQSGTENVWVVSADGAGARRVTPDTAAYMALPRWSPDGRALLVLKRPPAESAIRIHTNAAELWRHDVLSGTGVMLFGSAARTGPPRQVYEYINSHVTSPDGNTRWSIEPAGVRVTSLVAERRPPSIPSPSNCPMTGNCVFTPDSQAVIFAADGKLKRLDLVTYAVTDIPFTVDVQVQLGPLVRATRRLDDGPLLVQQLRAIRSSPDGQQLTFGAVGHVWLTAAGGTPRRLTTATLREYDPIFSPDGRWIAFVSWSDSAGGQLWKAPAAGGPAVLLAQGPEVYMTPCWTSDGTRIVFFADSVSVDDARGRMRDLLNLSLPDDFAPKDSKDRTRIRWVAAAGGTVHTIPNVRLTVGRQYSLPSLSVSGDGARVYYLNDRAHHSWSDGTYTRLESVRFDGSEAHLHARLRGFGVRVAPSPDGQWLAVQSSHNIFVVPFPRVGGRDSGPSRDSVPVLTITGPTPDPTVRRVTAEGGMAPAWSADGRELQWNWTHHLRRTRLATILQATPGRIPPRETAILLRVPRPIPAGKVLLRGARVVTMAARGIRTTRTPAGDPQVVTDPIVIEQGEVLIDRNRIAAVGPVGSVPVPADVTVLDVTGKTIIPGLIDAHVHSYRNHYVIPDQHPLYAAALALGVTTMLSPAWNYTQFAYAELIEAGGLMGPRTLGSLGLIDPALSGVEDRLTSFDVAKQVAHKHRSAGSTVLKEYHLRQRFQQQWLNMAAAREGTQVTNCQDTDYIDFNGARFLTYVLDGYAGWEHPDPLRGGVYKDVKALLSRAGTYWGHNNGARGIAGVRPSDAPKLSRFWPSDLEILKDENLKPEVEATVKAVRDMLRAGGNVAAGSHGGPELTPIVTHYVLHRFATELSPAEILRMATLNSARALGFEEDLGSIEVGKVADLLILNRNPLDDIRHSTDILYVVKNGHVLRAETLDAVWPVAKPFPGMAWHRDVQGKKNP